jgi:hypothetical protein
MAGSKINTPALWVARTVQTPEMTEKSERKATVYVDFGVPRTHNDDITKTGVDNGNFESMPNPLFNHHLLLVYRVMNLSYCFPLLWTSSCNMR